MRVRFPFNLNHEAERMKSVDVLQTFGLKWLVISFDGFLLSNYEVIVANYLIIVLYARETRSIKSLQLHYKKRRTSSQHWRSCCCVRKEISLKRD